MSKYIKLLPIFFVVFFINACTTLADARKSEGEGVKKDFHANFDQTWEAAVKSITNVKLELVSENKQQGYILAQRGMGVFQMSYGENVAVFVRKKDANDTTVEVVSKRVMETNIFAPDWSQDILDQISTNLK